MRRMAVDDDDGFEDAGSRYRGSAEDDTGTRRGRSERRRSSPGLLGRLFRLVRLLVFILPLTMLLLGPFLVDCRSYSANSILPDFVRTGACARENLTGQLSSFEDTIRTVSRAIR